MRVEPLRTAVLLAGHGARRRDAVGYPPRDFTVDPANFPTFEFDRGGEHALFDK
jgi:hypothetical protein